jgi:phosphatidylethanolamine-binding protein (PEBP) family uncharacterized protein
MPPACPKAAATRSQASTRPGESGYRGPAPPPGHGRHHYYFWIYAPDEDLDLEPGLDRRALLVRIEEHVLEQARLIGIYVNEG